MKSERRPESVQSGRREMQRSLRADISMRYGSVESHAFEDLRTGIKSLFIKGFIHREILYY